jgi:hypothetical protein
VQNGDAITFLQGVFVSSMMSLRFSALPHEIIFSAAVAASSAGRERGTGQTATRRSRSALAPIAPP